MESQRIPRKWVKIGKGLDLTSLRDGWTISAEPIATCLCLSLYNWFHTFLRRFCLTDLKDVSGGFPLEDRVLSKLSNDLLNVPALVLSLLHALGLLYTRQHLKPLWLYFGQHYFNSFPSQATFILWDVGFRHIIKREKAVTTWESWLCRNKEVTGFSKAGSHRGAG